MLTTNIKIEMKDSFVNEIGTCVKNEGEIRKRKAKKSKCTCILTPEI